MKTAEGSKISLPEEERIKLAESLGIRTQRDVLCGNMFWQIKESKKEWIWFSSGKLLREHLEKKYGLFKRKLSDRLLGLHYEAFRNMAGYAHDIKAYPQRIPMGVLLKYKEAQDSGLFMSFFVIDPDIRAPKCDPFLIGIRVLPGIFFDEPCVLICQWEDKTA